MNMKDFAKTMQNIEMSDGMQARILDNCYKKINQETEYKIMTKKTNRFFKKPLATAAAIALCLCIGGVTAIAATGKGYFKDKITKVLKNLHDSCQYSQTKKA